jgi:plastocyanin
MHRHRRFAALALIAACAIALPGSALAGAGGHASRSHTVVLKNIRFNPSTLSIRRGDTVTWVWRDGGTEHNVTGRGLRSHTQKHGSFAVRFTHTGTYNYRCTIHESEGMRGKVVVH